MQPNQNPNPNYAPQAPAPAPLANTPQPQPVASPPQYAPQPVQQIQQPQMPMQPAAIPTQVAQPQYAPQQQAPAPQPQQAPEPTRRKVKVVPGSNPNSTQNAIDIAEIRDGVVILNDGGYRAVIMAQSINFDLMSGQEREAVEFSYQGFLNSLYFDVQILIRSRKIDLQSYLSKLNEHLENQDNLLLSYLMSDYISFITSLSETTNIMDKHFYVVIPFNPNELAGNKITESKGFFKGIFGGKKDVITISEKDLNSAKTELKNRTQAAVNALSQVGVRAIPLDTSELIELYYDVYNPDTATRPDKIIKSELEAPYVTKGDQDVTNSSFNGVGQ